MFRALNRVIQNRFSTLPAPVLPGLGTIVKIRPKHFLAVLIGNDKNCILNNIDMFRVQNRVIEARFSTLPAPVIPEPQKGDKIRAQHFFDVIMENDKNCTTISIGMFRALNRSVSTFATPVGPFLPVRMRNNKKCNPNTVGMFRVSKRSHPGPIFNFAYQVGARAQKVVKIRPKHFSADGRETIETAPQTVWVCFGCQT